MIQNEPMRDIMGWSLLGICANIWKVLGPGRKHIEYDRITDNYGLYKYDMCLYIIIYSDIQIHRCAHTIYSRLNNFARFIFLPQSHHIGNSGQIGPRLTGIKSTAVVHRAPLEAVSRHCSC